MGWEKRAGKFYYYRKKRVDGRVRSIYMGCGERAVQASLEDGIEPPVAQEDVPNIRDVKKEGSDLEASRADAVAVPRKVLDAVAQPEDELTNVDIPTRARDENLRKPQISTEISGSDSVPWYSRAQDSQAQNARRTLESAISELLKR